MNYKEVRQYLLWPVIVVLVSGVSTYYLTKAISESETRAKYVELGADILRSKPREKAENEAPGTECGRLSIDEEALRTWAYKLVDTYSEVRMNDETRRALICRGVHIITVTGNIQQSDMTGSGTITVE